MMGKWRECTLGDLIHVKHGFAFLGEYFADRGSHVLLTPGNFFERGGFRAKGEKEKRYTGPIPADYVLQKGNVLVAMTEQGEGLLGSSAVVPADNLYLHNQRLGLVQVRDDRQADLGFVFHLFNSPTVRQQIRGSATGTKVRHTSPSRIAAVHVRVPPLPVQRYIARVLSAYDDLIENCERRIRVLDEMARALYREWFVLFRYPGHEKVPLVASSLGPIPKGWSVVSINDVCSRVTDGAHASPKSVERGFPMASSKDMHDWGLNLGTARHIAEEDYEQLVRNGCQPRLNDVLITKDGANYLKHILIFCDESNVVLLSSIAILRPNELISPSFLAAALKAPENRDRLKNYVTGAAIPRIVLKDFKAFQIVLPNAEALSCWNRLAAQLYEQCWKLSLRINNLRKTHDLLLPRLLSGQLSIEDTA